jgi:hypothetical protein
MEPAQKQIETKSIEKLSGEQRLVLAVAFLEAGLAKGFTAPQIMEDIQADLERADIFISGRVGCFTDGAQEAIGKEGNIQRVAIAAMGFRVSP